MPPADFPDQPLPEKDFDPDQLHLVLRVTLSADRKAVDPVVQEVMAVVRQMKGIDGKEDAIELSLQEALANAVIHGGVAWFKSDAALTVLSSLPGYRWTRGLFAVPKPLRDAVYDLVAKNRYRIFGKYDACFVPDADVRARVVE